MQRFLHSNTIPVPHGTDLAVVLGMPGAITILVRDQNRRDESSNERIVITIGQGSRLTLKGKEAEQQPQQALFTHIASESEV